MRNNSTPRFSSEDDWLRVICMLTDIDEPEMVRSELSSIGRFFGFAAVTNTRMLAFSETDQPGTHVYSILFSFDDPERRQQFLDLVRQNGSVGEVESFAVPSAEEIRRAQPVGLVFPREQSDLILKVGMVTAATLGFGRVDDMTVM